MSDKKAICPTCPTCKSAKSKHETRPFCSKRCAKIDLHRWLGEKYSIPAVEPADNWAATSFTKAASDSDPETDPHIH